MIKNALMRQGVLSATLRIVGVGASALSARLVARSLGPENLGISGMVVATVAQIALLMDLFPQALLVRSYMNTERPETKVEIYCTVFGTRIALALLVSSAWFLLHFLGKIQSGFLMAGTVGVVLLYFRAASPVWLFQAHEMIGYLGLVDVLGPVGNLVLYMLFLKSGASAGMDLLLQSIVAGSILVFSLLKIHSVVVGKKTSLRYSWPLAKSLLWRGRWISIVQLSSYLYTSFELALLGYIKGVTIAGQYRTAQTIVLASYLLISLIPLLLFPRFVVWRAKSPEYLWSMQKRIGGYIAVLAFLSSIGAIVLIPVIHPWWFGSAYIDATYPAVILVVAKLVGGVNSIFFWGVMANPDFDKRVAILMASVSIVSVLADLVIIPSHGMIGAACCNLASEITVLFGSLYLARMSGRASCSEVALARC